jgi:hypothetical protein
MKVKTLKLSSLLKENKFCQTGWFEKFKAQTRMHNVKSTGEALSAENDTAAKFYECQKKNNNDNRGK